MVGVLSACGSSDSGEDVERETGADSSHCPNGPGSRMRAQAAPEVDWHGCDLSHANLRGADLTAADLSRAYLSRANLTGANLTGADLIDVDLTGADLTGVDLTGADLTGALCNNETVWPDGTKGHGTKCPSIG